jgi:hypothetical protein
MATAKRIPVFEGVLGSEGPHYITLLGPALMLAGTGAAVGMVHLLADSSATARVGLTAAFLCGCPLLYGWGDGNYQSQEYIVAAYNNNFGPRVIARTTTAGLTSGPLFTGICAWLSVLFAEKDDDKKRKQLIQSVAPFAIELVGLTAWWFYWKQHMFTPTFRVVGSR